MKRHNMKVSPDKVIHTIKKDVKPVMRCKKCKAVIPERNIWLRDGVWIAKCRLRPFKDVYKKRGAECGRVEYLRINPRKLAEKLEERKIPLSVVRDIVKQTTGFEMPFPPVDEKQLEKFVDECEKGLDDFINKQELQHESHLPD